MSLRLSRSSLASVVGILMCGSTFAALGGCAHRSPRVDEPSVRVFPGVHMTRTRSGGFSMRILSGLAGDGQPLYIIDDSPVMLDPNRGIDWFEPEDIVRIRVLKDPAEMAVYGPNGVNGVILITTKHGARPRK